jgi:hypothetical protein
MPLTLRLNTKRNDANNVENGFFLNIRIRNIVMFSVGQEPLRL